MNLFGNATNISSLLNQTFGNGTTNTGPSSLTGLQRGNAEAMASSDPLANNLSTDVGFIASPSSLGASSMPNSGSSGQVQNQQILVASRNAMALDQQSFQHAQQSMQQHPASHGEQQQQQKPRFQSIQGGLSGMHHVKLEPQMTNNHIGQQKQLHSLWNSGPVKLEPQHNQFGRGIGLTKLEHQPSDKVMHLQQQQQPQQQFLQSSQVTIAHMNLLQQQRILQLQQQPLKALPHQQQQFQQHNLPIRSAVYEPGMCARRLTQYMYQQQHRPNDNNIEFWRKFVAEFFAPKARKRWCLSLYGSMCQIKGVLPQDIWHCEICEKEPVYAFETTVDVLPRLFKIKYDSGILEELLHVDVPHEYWNTTGQIVLEYGKAIQESVLELLRVVRDGQLRIVFSPDLKICSWEFCSRNHEELIPRRLITPPVSHLGAVAQKYQTSTQNASSGLSSPDCNMFITSAYRLKNAFEMPLVHVDTGYTKQFFRGLQTSEIVYSMKDLMDHCQETGQGPRESLVQFYWRSRSDPSSGLQLAQPPEEQQDLSNDHNSVQASVAQPPTTNGVRSATNSHGITSTSTSNASIIGLQPEFCSDSISLKDGPPWLSLPAVFKHNKVPSRPCIAVSIPTQSSLRRTCTLIMSSIELTMSVTLEEEDQ